MVLTLYCLFALQEIGKRVCKKPPWVSLRAAEEAETDEARRKMGEKRGEGKIITDVSIIG